MCVCMFIFMYYLCVYEFIGLANYVFMYVFSDLCMHVYVCMYLICVYAFLQL